MTICPSRSHVRAVLALLALIATAGGCSHLRASSARQRYINDQTATYVYQQPINEVWPHVRKTLFERGYQAKGVDSGGSYSVETEPRAEEKRIVRYLVQGTKVDDGHCRIEVTKMSEENGRVNTSRDLEMEWLLIQRAEPQGAQQITTGAEAEANKARAAS